MQAFYFAQVLYHVCMAAAKLSILYTYIRIFAGRVSNKWFKRTVQTIQAILLLYSLIILVVTIAQCIPVSYAFDWTKHGECMNRNMLFTAVIVTNIITDTAILTILIAVVMSLKISLRKRCVLYGTMMIGCLGLAVAMARLITSYISYDDHICMSDTSIWTMASHGYADVWSSRNTPLVSGSQHSLQVISTRYQEALSRMFKTDSFYASHYAPFRPLHHAYS